MSSDITSGVSELHRWANTVKEVALVALPLLAFYWFAKKIGRTVHEGKKRRWQAVVPKKIQRSISYVSPVRGPRFYLLTVDVEYELGGTIQNQRVSLWDESYASHEAAQEGYRRLFKNPEIYVNPQPPHQAIK